MRNRIASYAAKCSAIAFAIFMAMGCLSEPRTSEVGDWIITENDDFGSDAVLYFIAAESVEFSHGRQAFLATGCWSSSTGIKEFSLHWKGPIHGNLEFDDEGRGQYGVSENSMELNYILEVGGPYSEKYVAYLRPAGSGQQYLDDLAATEGNDMLEVVLYTETGEDLRGVFGIRGFTEALAETPCVR